MPTLFTSITTWMNALSWGLYGFLIVKDFYVYAPNVLGLSLATFQIFLYCVLPAKHASIDDTINTETNGSDSYSKVPLHEVELGETISLKSKQMPLYQ